MNVLPNEILISRTVAAPRDLVFDAWTRSDHLDRWMGPNGFVTTTKSMDFRLGGEWRYAMAHAQYGSFPNRIKYLEIVTSERMVYHHDNGEDGDPGGFQTTVTFTTTATGTRIDMLAQFSSVEACETAKKFAADGGHQTLGRLDDALAVDAETDLLITREFAAPRALVWAAWTDAVSLAQWWGPKGFVLGVARLDVVFGGQFHYSMAGAAGTGMEGPFWGLFAYREVVAPERLVFVNSLSNTTGAVTRHPMAQWPREVHNTVNFEAIGERTRIVLRARPLRASAPERKLFATSRAGVQEGFGGQFDQLDMLLAMT